jgi:hypothetical protein
MRFEVLTAIITMLLLLRFGEIYGAKTQDYNNNITEIYLRQVWSDEYF